MALLLYPHQIKAITELKSGSVLVADVGTGKSRTALAYYYVKECGGKLRVNGNGKDRPMSSPRPLYIICPAKKRDSKEWESELTAFDIPEDMVTIDSWNNIKKYDKVYGAFFIFDEQRVIGSGAWVKAFLRIARRNRWILLTGTPADTWMDLVPVFVANGFYKNKSEFCKRHVVYSRFAKYPKVDRYMETKRLERLRDMVYVRMIFYKNATPHHVRVLCNYNKKLYKTIWRDRWDPYEDRPIPQIAKLCYLLRRCVNEDASRINAVASMLSEHPRVIIFYNYTYEHELLAELCSSLDVHFDSWNGQTHEELPTGDRWAYLVQYNAGAEAWNCVTTDTMIFYSANYSYRIMAQAAGRIDRLNTSYDDLYYYHLQSHAPIDLAIDRAIKEKKKFNERSFVSG